MDEGRWYCPEEGSPQGSAVSPLLANIYLHYVFDLWSERRRRTQLRGAMIVVRYGDDMVVGFEQREEAEACLQDVRGRFNDFGLQLHSEKTRLLEFGHFAVARAGQ
ncbi:MAG: reverse transcriptase/maturase family protein, partial [Gammaproteobacteria bacterium]